MGVRPPQSDTTSPDSVEFGIAAVTDRLESADLSFPADATEIERALSDPEIDYDARGNAVRLSEALDRADRDRFGDRQELLNALHPVFEEYRTSRAPGLVEQVRSLLPF